MITNLNQSQFADAAIRRFLLGQLAANKQAQFERALFLDSTLERKTRLEEIALADDYTLRRLRGQDARAFVERFPLSSARRNQIEVSRALSECFAPAAGAQPTVAFLKFKHPVWKLAFATMILIMLFATIWLATKEPRIVRLPHRIRPTVATTPAPEVGHHAERTSEPATHRGQQPPTPGHELSTDMVVVLDSTMTAGNAPSLTLETIRDKNVRVQLILNEACQSIYRAELIKSTGEVVFSEAEIPVDANANRVNFAVPIERLAAGDFQIKLTRTSDGKQTIYFLRMK